MGIVKRNVTLKYHVGTRTASVNVPYEPQDGLLPQMNDAIEEAWNRWREEHGEWLEIEPLREDMFITVSFTTTHMTVEVSDRFRHI